MFTIFKIQKSVFVQKRGPFVLSLMLACVGVSDLALARGAKRPKSNDEKSSATPVQVVRPSDRLYTWDVDVGAVDAQTFVLDTGVSLDLDTALRMQFVTALLKSGRFTVRATRQGEPGIMYADGGKTAFAPMAASMAFDAENADCEIDPPQLTMRGQILGMEFESSDGIRFGYSPQQTIGQLSGSVGVSVKRVRLDLATQALHPLSLKYMASALVDQRRATWNVDATINFSDFIVRYDRFFESPLGKLTAKAMEMSVRDLIGGLSPYVRFESHVTVVDQAGVVGMSGGLQRGVRVGDEFRVRNLKHYWKGTPCQSTYLGARPDPNHEAWIKIYDVDSTHSWGRVIRQTGPLYVGDLVTQ